ncbi:hypothetical protein ES703_78129 [subsurface metagenome]
MGRGKLVTEGEIEEMIRMRRQGYSIEAIAESTGRHRHTVRTHLEERHAHGLADDARREVMIQELRRHLDELSQFGASLVEHLTVPNSPHEIRDAVAVLYTLRSGQNKVLFESFLEHTRGVWWEALEDWEHAWDNCIWALGELRTGAGEVIENILRELRILNRTLNVTGIETIEITDPSNLAKEVSVGKDAVQPKDEMKMDLLDVLMASISRDKDAVIAVKRITDGIVHLLWQHIIHPDEVFPLVEAVPRADGHIDITFGKDRFTNYLIVREQGQADKIMGICKSAAEKMRGDTTEAVVKEIVTMQARIEEFREAMSPLRLRPLLLRSRCNLCPA